MPSHLDEDQLSAALDGELDPEAAEHGDACDECRARLADWRRVVGLVAAVPVRPADGQVEEAVGAALADGFGLEPGRPSTGPEPDASVRSMAGAEGASPTPIAARRHFPMGSPRVRLAAAVAAALILVGVVAAVASHHGGSGQGQVSAASSATAPAISSASSSGAASGTHGAASPAPGGAEREQLRPPSTLPSAVTSPAASRPSYESPGSLVAALRVDLNAPIAPGHLPHVSNPAVETCLAPATTAAGVPAGTAPVFEATVTYRGSPAEVYVFSVNRGQRAAVVRTPGCQALAVVSF
jgi:hypothetical protein